MRSIINNENEKILTEQDLFCALASFWVLSCTQDKEYGEIVKEFESSLSPSMKDWKQHVADELSENSPCQVKDQKIYDLFCFLRREFAMPKREAVIFIMMAFDVVRQDVIDILP